VKKMIVMRMKSLAVLFIEFISYIHVKNSKLKRSAGLDFIQAVHQAQIAKKIFITQDSRILLNAFPIQLIMSEAIIDS
jgi:hypothetical protein